MGPRPSDHDRLGNAVTITFKGRAERLTDMDLPDIAAIIGAGEAELRAVIEVETAGGGFDSGGNGFGSSSFMSNAAGLSRAVCALTQSSQVSLGNLSRYSHATSASPWMMTEQTKASTNRLA